MNIITFDESQADFRAAPSVETARAYEREANTYRDDHMIGMDTYNAAIAEIVAYREQACQGKEK